MWKPREGNIQQPSIHPFQLLLKPREILYNLSRSFCALAPQVWNYNKSRTEISHRAIWLCSDGSETTVLPLRFRLWAAGAVILLSTRCCSSRHGHCGALFRGFAAIFSRDCCLCLSIWFLRVIWRRLSHSVGSVPISLWRICFVFLSIFAVGPFSGALPQRPLLSGLQKNSKWVNWFLPVNLSVRWLQLIVVYIASVTVRIASERATETQSLIPERTIGLQVGTKLLGEGSSYWRLSGEKRRKHRKNEIKGTGAVCSGLLILLFLLLEDKLISPHESEGSVAVPLAWNTRKGLWSILAWHPRAAVHTQNFSIHSFFWKPSIV